jgi:hypothetical protein
MGQARPFDEDARRATARWLESWSRMAPLLEARRVAELRQLTDESAARIAVDLVWPLAPTGPGDDGAGLTPMHVVLQRLSRR